LDDRIDVLKAKKDHLEHHATVGDKIKAFFKHGLEGVDGEVAKINKKIDATQHARDDVDADVSVEQRQKELDQLKDKQATLAQEKQNAKGVLLMKNMEASGMNVGSTVSDKAVKEARDTYAKVKPEQKDLAKEIKAKEKVLSVREKLGPKTGGTGKSQDLGHNHGV
jgi:DNA repair exonuclease SbcCD ATPase subunit